jgi:RNA polymerase-binding transcription factor DksA
MPTVTPSRRTAPAATATRWAPFRSMLQEQRADCARQRQLALADTVGSMPDPVAMARSAQLLRIIEEIDAALARLEAGTYGRCVACGSVLPAERLEFRPFAAACVTCQQGTA